MFEHLTIDIWGTLIVYGFIAVILALSTTVEDERLDNASINFKLDKILERVSNK